MNDWEIYLFVLFGKFNKICCLVIEEDILNFVFIDGSDVLFFSVMWIVGDFIYLVFGF